MPGTDHQIARHRTAISRKRLSRPVARAVADGIITKGRSVLDFGCGRGDDVRLLREQGVRARGWDPHYAPDGDDSPADVVICSYVANVIEDPRERDRVLRRAWKKARREGLMSGAIHVGIFGVIRAWVVHYNRPRPGGSGEERLETRELGGLAKSAAHAIWAALSAQCMPTDPRRYSMMPEERGHAARRFLGNPRARTKSRASAKGRKDTHAVGASRLSQSRQLAHSA